MSDVVDISTYSKFADEINSIQRKDLAILRTHLYAEHYLEELLRKFLPRGEELKDFRFNQKVAVLSALGHISPPLRDNLRLLNQTRNKLVHNLEIDEIYHSEIVPLLQQMNWLSNETGELYEERKEDTYESKYVYKLILTVTALHNMLAAAISSDH